MPILNNDPLSPIKHDYQRGNLIVKFDIQFPMDLSEENKFKLTEMIDSAC